MGILDRLFRSKQVVEEKKLPEKQAAEATDENKPLGYSAVETDFTNEWIKLLLEKMKITESDISHFAEMDRPEVREMFGENEEAVRGMFGEHGRYMVIGIVYMNVNQPDRAFCCLAKYIQLSEDGPQRRDAIRLFLKVSEQVLNRYVKQIPELIGLPPEMKRLRGTKFELLSRR